jgi:hypothetical protein
MPHAHGVFLGLGFLGIRQTYQRFLRWIDILWVQVNTSEDIRVKSPFFFLLRSLPTHYL